MAKKPKKSGRQNYDWAVIMHDYVTDPKATLRNISEKYQINYVTVAKKSKADNWFATRKEHQQKVISKAISKTANKQANELAKEMQFLSAMKDRMSDVLADSDQFHRHLTINAVSGETEEKVLDKVDTRALKESMQVLKMIEEMSRSLYNIQKAEAIQKQQIERERLELDKQRLELERERNALRTQNTDEESRYGVVIMPEVLTDEG